MIETLYVVNFLKGHLQRFFEEGTYTGHGAEEQTCKVEVNTTFTDCYFKAPYIIDFSALGDKTVKFEGKCLATSTSDISTQISLAGLTSCTRIVITSSPQGDLFSS